MVRMKTAGRESKAAIRTYSRDKKDVIIQQKISNSLQIWESTKAHTISGGLFQDKVLQVFKLDSRMPLACFSALDVKLAMQEGNFSLFNRNCHSTFS